MKKFSLNKIAVIGLALGGLCVFSSTAVMAAEECKPKVTNPDNGENPDDGTPPTGATGGAGEFSTASAFNGIPRVSEFSEQETQETRGDCGATVGESSDTQAQEVAMTIGTKIINQRAARKRSGNTGRQVTAFDFQAFGGSASEAIFIGIDIPIKIDSLAKPPKAQYHELEYDHRLESGHRLEYLS